MNIPDEFGLFPFQRFTADELRHFFVWCAAHKVSDVDLTGGSPVSVSRFGRRVRCSSATLPTTLMSSLIDELFGREVIPRVLAGNPVDRTIHSQQCLQQWKRRCCWKSRRRRSGPEQQRKHQRQPESYGERSSFS